MKTHLSVLFMTAILVAGIGTAPSFAQVVGPITVSTDKQSYVDGDVVMIEGQVADVLSGTPVSLQLLAPNGNRVALEQLQVGDDKMFSYEAKAAGPYWKAAGDYTVKVQYGGPNRVAETMFGFAGAGSVQPPPTEMPDDTTRYSLDAGEGGMHDITYSITGGSISSMNVDGDTSSFTVMIESDDDGELVLTLPRAVIDAKMNGCEGDDDAFVVLIDGEEREFTEDMSSADRTLTIPFLVGDEEIEIIGSCAIPEFGTIAVLVLAVAIVSIIAVSARSRLGMIMPKY